MPETERQQILSTLATLESEIRALGVETLSLFGSAMRDEMHKDSDIDILVRFRLGEKNFSRFLELSELLEHHLGRRVELITTEALSPFFGPHILSEALDVIELEREGPQTVTAREGARRLALLGGTEKELRESKRRRTNRG